MLNSKDLRIRAWNSLKGKYWKAFAVVLVLGLLASIGSGAVSCAQLIMNSINKAANPEVATVIQSKDIALSIAALVLSVVGLLVSVFVGNAVTVGLCNYFIRNTDSKPAFKDGFYGFKVRYGRNIGAILLVNIKTALWTLLLVVPGIIKTYEYALIPYILADDPEISSKDAFKKSKEMMMGNKWRLFKLNFSFIGWIILCVLTLGIGTFFLMPYIDAANAEFYAEIKNK